MHTATTAPARAAFAGPMFSIPGDRDRLPDHPFKIRNRMADHPLFEPARIKQLLRRLPRDMVEIRAVETVDAFRGDYRRGRMVTDADPVATFERLEEKPAWMLLHRMWIHDPDYDALIRQYVAGLGEQCEDLRGQLTDLGCWMFLSSGRIVVHFHADPDQSFLNQIRGSKTVYVYPTAIVPERAVEDLVATHDQGVIVYQPEYEQAMFAPVHLDPGEGVFLPLYAPHRVVNDEGVSVSLNIGFHTRRSRRRKAVHLVNRELRQRGLRPEPFGRNTLVDTFKHSSFLALRGRDKLKHLLGR
jgi:hypothetical protein